MPAPGRSGGQPRVYCSRRCRSRQGHAAEQERRRSREPVEWTAEQLDAYLDGLAATFTDPMAGFG
jgi:hypothetical protein